ncbi:MAG: N-acetylmuramoyl-L-alanine amidase [Clostridiales bacterium]|nr:N-acetylmuramoyl-L-alanine amidase [Clostridiales bacterium]
MKIAIRGGHTERCSGSNGIINELTEDRKVKNELIAILSSLGHDVLDCTPPVNYTDSQSIELAYGVNKANSFGADLFISIHFNNAYNSYDGAIGSEVCVYNRHDTAERIACQLGDLGFTNRGQKIMPELYELKHTKMKAAIVEVCFVEATKDVQLYNNLGPKRIADAIASGIIGNRVTSNNAAAKQIQSSISDNWILRLQKELNAQGFGNLVLDGIAGPKTLASCPLLKIGAQGNITKLLQEKLGISSDGIFGPNTKKAVELFQKNNGLVVDGIVGINTWRKLLY